MEEANRRKLARSGLTVSGCLTFLEMSKSGAMIGSLLATTEHRHGTIHKVHHLVRLVCIVAAVTTASLGLERAPIVWDPTTCR